MSENDDQTFKSIDELESNKCKWNLMNDLKLLNLLKNNGDEFLNKIRNNLTEIENLSFQTNSSANNINNLITSILILTNVKFIENRVYDEDIKDIAITNNNGTNKNNFNLSARKFSSDDNDEKQLINRLENSIDDALKRFTSKYKIPYNDLVENDNNYNLLHKLYSQNNSFMNENLPYIIGSDDYLKDTFVGMKNEDNQTVIDLTNSKNFESKFKDVIDHNYDNNENQTNIPELIENIQNKNDSSFTPIHTVSLLPNTSEQKAQSMIDNIFENNAILNESSEDDDIFVRPAKNNCDNDNKSSKFDNELNDEELFQSTSTSPSNQNAGKMTDSLFIKESEYQDRNVNQISSNDLKNKDRNIFLDDDSDDDFDNLFSKKTSRESALKIAVDDFLDNDEDDDLFDEFVSNNQSDSTSLVINETVDDMITSEMPIETAVDKIPSKPSLSNVIKELNTVIQNKVLSPTNKKDTTNSTVLLPNDTAEKKVTFQTANLDPHDDLNSMLKHKSNISSNRQRKPPSRNALRKSLLKPQSLFEDNESDEIDDVESKSQIGPPVTTKSKPDTSSVKSYELEPEKDEYPAPKISEQIEKSKLPNKTNSLFDSSSSDEDIFGKPSILNKNKPLNSKNIVKTTSLFSSDSDSNDDDFESLKNSSKLLSSSLVNSKAKTSAAKVQQTHKSIFDDDSDSDDLFKF